MALSFSRTHQVILATRMSHRSFATSTSRQSQLAGTVGAHNSVLYLHTHSPPELYPAKFKSPLFKALTLAARSWGGTVNFSWAPDQPVHPKFTSVANEESQDEAYCATAFSPLKGCLSIPEISLDNLDEVEGQLKSHALVGEDYPLAPPAKERDDRMKLHLYVCTHGERDCRCGETGGEVYCALRKEVEKRGIADQVTVGAVGHVGGHKYAANLLIYPHGDWLGTLQAFDVPSVLDEILERHASTTSLSTLAPPICPPFWRGRMGLDKEEQLKLVIA